MAAWGRNARFFAPFVLSTSQDLACRPSVTLLAVEPRIELYAAMLHCAYIVSASTLVSHADQLFASSAVPEACSISSDAILARTADARRRRMASCVARQAFRLAHDEPRMLIDAAMCDWHSRKR